MIEAVYTVIDRLSGEVAKQLLASTSRTAAIVDCSSPDRPLRWPIVDATQEDGEQLFRRLLTGQLPAGGCYTAETLPMSTEVADRCALFAQLSAVREQHTWLIWQLSSVEDKTLREVLPYFELVYLVIDGAAAIQSLPFDLRAWRRKGIRPQAAWYVNAA